MRLYPFFSSIDVYSDRNNATFVQRAVPLSLIFYTVHYIGFFVYSNGLPENRIVFQDKVLESLIKSHTDMFRWQLLAHSLSIESMSFLHYSLMSRSGGQWVST